MKKLLITFLCVIMVMVFMPTMAFAEVADTDVAEINGVGYPTLKAAIDSVASDEVATINLLKDVDGGVVIGKTSSKNIIIDLNGFTFDAKEGVGSAGTETNGLQLYKGSTITIKNGTIKYTGSDVKTLVKNYANLTLENVKAMGVVVNTGQLKVIGDNTEIITPDGQWSITTGNYAKGDIITTDIYAGKISSVAIEIVLWSTGSATVNESVTTTIHGGQIGKVGEYDWRADYGDKYKDEPLLENWKLNITGGTFTSAPDAKYIADNYTTYEKAGKYTVGLAFKSPVADAGTEEVPTAPTETTVKNEMTTVITDIVTGAGTTAVSKETANKIIEAVTANPNVVIKTEVAVAEKKASDVKPEDIAKVEAKVKKDEKIGQYFDLSLIIKAGDEELGTLNKLSKPVKFTLDIPKELQDAKNVFSIIRVHEGDPRVLPTTVDTKNWTISFETDSFSTYALTYTDKAPATEVPKTSDANNMLPWLAAMALAAGAAVVLKRREN